MVDFDCHFAQQRVHCSYIAFVCVTLGAFVCFICIALCLYALVRTFANSKRTKSKRQKDAYVDSDDVERQPIETAYVDSSTDDSAAPMSSRLGTKLRPKQPQRLYNAFRESQHRPSAKASRSFDEPMQRDDFAGDRARHRATVNALTFLIQKGTVNKILAKVMSIPGFAHNIVEKRQSTKSGAVEIQFVLHNVADERCLEVPRADQRIGKIRLEQYQVPDANGYQSKRDRASIFVNDQIFDRVSVNHIF